MEEMKGPVPAHGGVTTLFKFINRSFNTLNVEITDLSSLKLTKETLKEKSGFSLFSTNSKAKKTISDIK
jgi:hypothetical protein